MATIRWTPIAESELEDIVYFISRVGRSPAAGEKIYFEIRGRIEEYVNKGMNGHVHPDAPEGWLYLKHKRWLIFYQPSPNGIEVMRVIDGVRDLPRRLPLE